MRELSFWLVHGTHVWQAVLVLATVLGVAASWLLIDRAMRARAARVREAMGAPRSKVTADDAGKEVVLSGRIVASERARRERGDGDRAEEPAAGTAAVATVIPQGFELAEEATAKAVTGVAHGKSLEIDVGGVRVTVDAPIQVIVGARETERCMAADAVRAMLWDFAAQLGKLPPKGAAVRTLAFGDLVRVRGLLRHEPDYDATDDYRSAHGVFWLVLPPVAAEAGADATKHLPVAFEGAPRPLARRPLRLVARAAAFPLGALVLLSVVGEVGMRLASPIGASVAAVTPLRRADALAALRAKVPLASRADERLLGRAVELDLLRARCGDASDDLYEHGSVAASADTAVRCGDPVRAARGFAGLGDFERAAAALVAARALSPELAPTLTEASVLLVAGKYAEAAAATRALARHWEGEAGDRDRLECAADAIEARTGSATARDALAARQGQHDSCTLLLADLLHGEERRTLFRTRSRFPMYFRSVTSYFLTAQLLELEEDDTRSAVGRMSCRDDLWGEEDLDCRTWNGEYFEVSDAAALYADPRRHSFLVPPALVKQALDKLGDEDSALTITARARLSFMMVPFDSFLGRTEVARQRLAAVKERARAFAGEEGGEYEEKRPAWQEHLRRLSFLENRFGRETEAEVERELERERAVGPAIGYDSVADSRGRAARWVVRNAEALEAALEVRDFRVPGPPPASQSSQAQSQAGGFARAELELFARGRSGDAAGISGLAQRDQREANLRLWDLLRAGDGAALAERMRIKGLDGRGVVENVRGVGSGREELAGWLRWSYPAACSTCGLYPLANRTASRIDAARAIEEPGVEAGERAIAERLHEVFFRRDIALPLAILSELSPP